MNFNNIFFYHTDPNLFCYISRDIPEVSFTGGSGVDGKKYDTTRIRGLGWTPAHPSLHQFMAKL